MIGLRFTVRDACAEPHAVGPTLVLRLCAEATGGMVHAAIVRADLRVDVGTRTYSTAEGDRLLELLGTRDRWPETMRSLAWTQVSFALPAFGDARDVLLPIACTYDFDLAAAKYFHALDDGEIPLRLLFSGSVFSVTDGMFHVSPIPWETEASFRLPVRTWREVMDRHFHGTTWIRLRRESFDALHRFRMERVLPSWDATVDALCLEARPREAV